MEEGRTSSRVLQAPGGRSSISLSWNDDCNSTGNVSMKLKTLNERISLHDSEQ